MRTVVVFLVATTEAEVVSELASAFPFQEGPPWICETGGDPCLYIDFLIPEDAEDGWLGVEAVMGQEAAVIVGADVSGRHPGDSEVRQFVEIMLTKFRGVAQDDYSDHFWRLDEIRSDKRIDGRGFFCYQR